MDNIKIIGKDADCIIAGENFSYRFINGHPTEIIKDGKREENVPVPEENMKSKGKLVHKYWDSALVLTEYRKGLKKIKVKYRILSTGELLKEISE